MNLDHQLNFLRILASQNTEAARRFFVSPDFDSVEFRNFILEHELFFYSDLLDHFYPGDYLTPDIVRELREYRNYQWVKNEKLLLEIHSLSVLLMRHQVEAVVLKGPFLAKRFYPASNERVIHDIDLLVKKENIEAVDKILLATGYQRTFLAPLGRKLTSYFVHHFAYRRQDYAVEIHWCLDRHIALRIDYPLLWLTKISYKFRHENYFVFSPEYELVTQILSIFGDIQRGWFKFKSFLDAVMVLRGFPKNFDWDDFFNRRKKEKIFIISLNVLDLLLDLTGTYGVFSELAGYLKKNNGNLRYKKIDDKQCLLKRTPFGIKQKKWAQGLYESPSWIVLLWWLLSLPFRLLVHCQDFESRCRSFLAHIKPKTSLNQLWPKRESRTAQKREN